MNDIKEFLLELAEKFIDLLDKLISMDFRSDAQDDGLRKH